mgnify:CR=1 FL=1
MKQYKIWNVISNPSYNTPKSFGANEYAHTTVNVGTSARNSFKFLTHEVTHEENADGTRTYKFLVDGVCVKGATYNPKTKQCIAEGYIAELKGQDKVKAVG